MNKTANYIINLVVTILVCFFITITFSSPTNAAQKTHSGALPPTKGRTDLALSKKVNFAPKPNYSLTKKGGTDSIDLTDGKISKRKDHRIWFDKAAVGWRYSGRVNLAVDLGKRCKINEVAIRFNDVSKKGGASMPGWVEVLASDDGEHYYRVDEFSHFKKGDIKKFHIPQQRKDSWVYALQFKNLDITARYVGVRFYGSAGAYSDELYVFGKPAKNKNSKGNPKSVGTLTGFSVHHAQMYFHKPYLKVATNISLPVPIGMVTPDSKKMKEKEVVTLNLPKGIKIVGGNIGSTKANDAKKGSLSNEGTSYQFIVKNPHVSKVIGRLYIKAPGWSDGQKGEIHYSFSQGDWNSGDLTIPVSAVKVPKAPRLKDIMVGMGWWSSRGAIHWPDILHSYKVLGINTYSLVKPVYNMNKPRSADVWKQLRKSRKEGFFTSFVGSFFHDYTHGFKHKNEIHYKLKNGKYGKGKKNIDITYRGKYYKKEKEKFATRMARIRPDFASVDIELFGWRGPKSYIKKSPEAMKKFKSSGYSSLNKWIILQGSHIWSDMVNAVRAKYKKEGIDKEFNMGGYDFRPGSAYQNIWSVKQLYPKYMNSSQVSTYSPLMPKNIVSIGDAVRKDRRLLGESDIMPWISPGDAGVFPGRAFKWALLECYTNGARGVWFWSNRVWDSEDLIAYNKVVRAIAPVENIIIQGHPITNEAEVMGAGRVSGMEKDDDMVLLVSDYFGNTDGNIELQLNLYEDSVVTDLLDGGKVVKNIPSGVHFWNVNLHGKSARLLRIKPQ